MTINNELCDIMDLKEKSQITEILEKSLKLNDLVDYDDFEQIQKSPTPSNQKKIIRSQKQKKTEKVNFKYLVSIKKRNVMFQEKFGKENNLYTMTQQFPSKKNKKVGFNLNNFTKKIEKNAINTVNEDENNIILNDLLNYMKNLKNKKYSVNLRINNKKNYNFIPFQRNNSSDRYPILNTNLLKLINESLITKRSSYNSYGKRNSKINDNDENSIQNIIDKIQIINGNNDKMNSNNEEIKENLDSEMKKPIIIIKEKKSKFNNKKLPVIRLVKSNLTNFVKKMDIMDINLKNIKRNYNSFNEKNELMTNKIFKTEYNDTSLNSQLYPKNNNHSKLNSDKSENNFQSPNNKYYTKLKNLLNNDYRYNQEVVNKYFKQKKKESNDLNRYMPIFIKQSKPKTLYKKKNKNFLSPAHYKSFEIMNQIKQREKKNQDKNVFGIFKKNI